MTSPDRPCSPADVPDDITLAEFYLARLAEIERDARRAPRRPGRGGGTVTALSPAALDALRGAVADHRAIRLAVITDRKTYVEVDRALTRIAGAFRPAGTDVHTLIVEATR